MKIAGRDLDHLLACKSLDQLRLWAVFGVAVAELSIDVEAPGEDKPTGRQRQRMLPSTRHGAYLDFVEHASDKFRPAYLVLGLFILLVFW